MIIVIVFTAAFRLCVCTHFRTVTDLDWIHRIRTDACHTDCEELENLSYFSQQETAEKGSILPLS